MAELIDGFFYGLFMDEDVLAGYEVTARNPRPAYIDDFGLFIGDRATLAPLEGARSYGVVFALESEGFAHLYGGAGLEDYRPETLAVTAFTGEAISARCYNLPQRPGKNEANPEYAAKLQSVLKKLGFPKEYISGIS